MKKLIFIALFIMAPKIMAGLVLLAIVFEVLQYIAAAIFDEELKIDEKIFMASIFGFITILMLLLLIIVIA